MLRRVILSYLKRVADLQQDFAAEVRKRQVDKWEKSQLDKLNPGRVLERRMLEIQKKENSTLHLREAIESPLSRGLELIDQGLITGNEPEFVYAVQKFIEDQPRDKRDALSRKFEEKKVPLSAITSAALPTSEATSMVYEKWHKTNHEDGDLQELYRLKLENKISEPQVKVIAVSLLRGLPHRCIAYYKNQLVSKELAQSKFGEGLTKIPINQYKQYLKEGQDTLELSKDVLRDLVLENLPDRRKDIALRAVGQLD